MEVQPSAVAPNGVGNEKQPQKRIQNHWTSINWLSRWKTKDGGSAYVSSTLRDHNQKLIPKIDSTLQEISKLIPISRKRNEHFWTHFEPFVSSFLTGAVYSKHFNPNLGPKSTTSPIQYLYPCISSVITGWVKWNLVKKVKPQCIFSVKGEGLVARVSLFRF